VLNKPKLYTKWLWILSPLNLPKHPLKKLRLWKHHVSVAAWVAVVVLVCHHEVVRACLRGDVHALAARHVLHVVGLL
jgi:hypothetical protein